MKEVTISPIKVLIALQGCRELVSALITDSYIDGFSRLHLNNKQCNEIHKTIYGHMQPRDLWNFLIITTYYVKPI